MGSRIIDQLVLEPSGANSVIFSSCYHIMMSDGHEYIVAVSGTNGYETKQGTSTSIIHAAGCKKCCATNEQHQTKKKQK